ncbi:MAG: hypothetical protein LIP23_09405, partial [Planctomycetes bacterium]|nr:hypothetical protein [Planctomycetota bacterium]
MFAAALGAMFYYLPAPECRLPAAPAVGFSELFPSLRYDDGFDFAVAGVLPSNPTSAPQSGGAVFSVPYREIEIATLSAMTKPNSPGEVKNA